MFQLINDLIFAKHYKLKKKFNKLNVQSNLPEEKKVAHRSAACVRKIHELLHTKDEFNCSRKISSSYTYTNV